MRLPLDLPAIVERDGVRLSAVCSNIGLGGAFVRGLEGVGYAERVELWVPLLGPGTLSCLPSVVRWCDHLGFGVQFLEVGVREVHALSELIRANAKRELG